MTIKEYNEKRSKLFSEAEAAINAGKLEDAKTKKAEIEDLDKQFEAEKNARAELDAMKQQNAIAPAMQNEAQLGSETGAAKQYNVSSPEYRIAWLKDMARDAKGAYLCGTPTVEEQNAFTFTTANTGSLVPTETLNRIVELVDSMAPMLADSTQSNLTKGFAIPRHVSIDAGDAATTNEGVANEDEQDTFDLLELTGVEIKKHVDITKKMEFQSIDAFESWLVKHLAQRIAVAKESHILTRLSNTTYGIASANVLTGQTYSDDVIRSIFSKIKAQGAKVVYANNNTIWNGLYGIKDDNNRPVFLPNQMDGNQGSIYGAIVKQDENIADNVAYFGVPAEILTNEYGAIALNKDMDGKTFVTTVSSYSLFDAGLEKPLAFVKVTFTV